MARKTKGQLPSGNIRVQVYDYTDTDGKKHYQSFTAPTKAEAQAMAAEWKYKNKNKAKNVTIIDVVEEYIDINKTRISPTTYKTYSGYIRYFKEHKIGMVKLRDLTNTDVQRFINELCEVISVKTAKNVYLVLKPAVELKRDDFRFRIKMPEYIRNEKYIPSAEDIAKVYDACNCTEMRVVMLLAMQGMMRRGEISALEWDDINFKNKTITINKSIALTIDNEWVQKSTKTASSTRTVCITDKLIDEMNRLERSGSRVLSLEPSHITNRFDDTVKRAGVKKFTLHALRHFSESTASAIGIPAVYIEDIGGWVHGSEIRTRHYDHVIDIEQVRYNKMFLDKIESVLG